MAVRFERKMAELYDELHNRGYQPYALDRTGKKTLDPEKALTIGFTLRDENNVKSDPAYISMDKKPRKDIITTTIWVDGEVVKSPEFQIFHKFIKPWVLSKVGDIEIRKSDHFQFDMQKRAQQKMQQEKDNISEGYYPLGKKTSYSDNVPTVKIIIEHNRNIEEGEQRFRNVNRIFVETLSGERFLLPTNRPGLARVYARHIAEGGTPYDDKAKHITSLVEEYTKMAGFVRATKNGQFNESTQRLINEGVNHYNNLRETLTRLTSHRGYTKYFENYTPVLNEETDEATSLNELFVQETLDPRIENVMPILQRLSKNLQEMTEVNELAEWSQKIVEGGDGGEASEETDGDTPGDAGEGGAEDVSEDISEKKMANSQEVASVIADSLGGEEGLSSDDIYSSIDEYAELLAEKGYEVNTDKVAQILMDKLNIHLQEKMDSTTGSMAVPADKMLDEAPGAMTLKHNQNTEKSNLKAFDLDEGSGDVPIEKMTDEELADYLQVSVGFVKRNRKKAEQAARDKTDDNLGEDIDNLNTAQQSAQMQKQGGELKIPKQDFDSMAKGYAVDKGMQKDIKASTDKEGNIDATKLLSKGVDRMMPAMGGAVRDLNKVYYRDMPGKLQADQKRNPQEFKKQYDALDPESRAEIDKQLAITPAQAKANYKAQQGAADNQMTDMGYSKYGYNYNSQPVVGRIKNAGAWVKDKFNEEELDERVVPGQPSLAQHIQSQTKPDPAPELEPVKVQSKRPEGANWSKEYLQKAASNDGGRYMVSPDKAQQYLDTFHKEDVSEGSTKQAMWNDAENMSLERFTEKYGDEDWIKEFWHNINDIDEGLDANQKRAGQLGPTEPVGKNEKNLRGKLVGASESVELDRIKTLSGLK
jgi:hypothetical protein